jgi:UDP-N-acetylmuramoyl-L-alanyl-D-glutamate--2,6-diaminopimelate ligase
MKSFLKKLIPKGVLNLYHRFLAWMAAAYFGYPSEQLIVIGITGTNGKSTTANIIARILEGAGYKVGLTTTANFKIAEREWLNDKKMTMLGRFQLQKMLRSMVKAGCRYAVIETSSEGIRQHRHRNINYDVAVFTNLTPEHIESHGGFENYKHAKGELFAKLSRDPHKMIQGHEVPKTIVANLQDQHADYFLSFPADRKIGFAVPRLVNASGPGLQIKDLEVVQAENVVYESDRSRFSVAQTDFTLQLPGQFNVENALAAICVGRALDLTYINMASSLATLSGVPGRLENIVEGQDFQVIVDYAPEPESFRKLYEVVDNIKKNSIIHILGSCGGGRDVSRRPVLGRLAAEHAQVIFVTNEDPYDDDPIKIIEDVAGGARELGFCDGKNLFMILDRGEAIKKAINMAETGDLVLITGKGCEQAIVVADGKKIPWDDRMVVRQALKERLQKSN